MKNLLWIVALLAIFFVSESCRQDNRVGFNLIEDDQIFSNSDTIKDIDVRVVVIDTIRTDNIGVSTFGVVDDPIFGTTSAEVAMQFNLGGAINFRERDSVLVSGSEYRFFYHEFGRNPKADSIVLFLRYDTAAFTSINTLGDLNLKQQIDVRLLKDTLAIENFNVTEIDPLLSNESLGITEHTFTPDSLTFRFKVTNQEFVDTFLNNNTTAFESQSIFSERKFKGLALLNNTDDPSFICRFNLANSQTRLRVYFTNESIAEKDTVVFYDFGIDVSSSRDLAYTRYFTQIEHEYAGSEIEDKIENTSTENEKVYVQSLTGARTILKFPGIRKWFENEDYQVRFAHLVLRPVDEDNNDQFPSLELLEIYELSSDGETNPIAEYLGRDASGALTLVGEIYDPVDNEYRFDITSYVKKLRDTPNEEENGLILTARNRSFTLGRTTLHSANSNAENLRMFVKITYSRIE